MEEIMVESFNPAPHDKHADDLHEALVDADADNPSLWDKVKAIFS
jgi:hypothetical protein